MYKEQAFIIINKRYLIKGDILVIFNIELNIFAIIYLFSKLCFNNLNLSCLKFKILF